MQTCPQTFLQTVDPNSSTGLRVFYPDGNVSTNPVIRMTAQITLGPGLDARTVFGLIRVSARLSVRGRRGVPLSADQQVAMFSKKEQQLAFEYLASQQKMPSARKVIGY